MGSATRTVGSGPLKGSIIKVEVPTTVHARLGLFSPFNVSPILNAWTPDFVSVPEKAGQTVFNPLGESRRTRNLAARGANACPTAISRPLVRKPSPAQTRSRRPRG